MSRSFPAARQRKQVRQPKVVQRNSELLNHGPTLSLNQASTLRWSFEEDVLRYRLAGIDTMGVWLPKLLEYGEDRGLEWLCENGMSVSTLSYAGGFTGAFGHELDDVLEETLDLIHLAGHSGDIRWNFEKFLVGRDGKVVCRFNPTVAPDAPEVVSAIKEQLGK